MRWAVNVAWKSIGILGFYILVLGPFKRVKKKRPDGNIKIVNETVAYFLDGVRMA